MQKTLFLLVFLTLGCMGSGTGGSSVVEVTTLKATTSSAVESTTTTALSMVAHFTNLEVTDSLLKPEKTVCSPSSEDGSPYCGDIYKPGYENSSIYQVITEGVCPGVVEEDARQYTIYNRLLDTNPPKGEMRTAYFCKSLGIFWVYDYEYKDGVPKPYWYGPFSGFPAKPTVNPGDEFAVGVCKDFEARFWQIFCMDDLARAQKDPTLCRSVYCLAEFKGKSVCQDIYSQSDDWFSFREKACEALADGTHFTCDRISKSEQCIRWYSIMTDNVTLCNRADKGKNECYKDFAFWRGDPGYCNMYNTINEKRDCMGYYDMMRYLGSKRLENCDLIDYKRHALDCRKYMKMDLRDPDHIFYEMDKELVNSET